MKKPPEQRKAGEIECLMPFIKQIRYFSDKPEIKENDYIFICEHLTYECYTPNKNIICVGKEYWILTYMMIGEYGDKFYVILEGQVSVLVPQKKKAPEEAPQQQ